MHRYVSNTAHAYFPQASSFLLESIDTSASSNYGAIWFSHERTSVFADDGMPYDLNVTGQCKFLAPELNYTKECARYAGFGYVIQFNFTAIHASLLYETLANEALVRQATSPMDIFRRNTSALSVETTIAPLPVTAVEENVGAGEDAFAAWFLVSSTLSSGRLLGSF